MGSIPNIAMTAAESGKAAAATAKKIMKTNNADLDSFSVILTSTSTHHRFCPSTGKVWWLNSLTSSLTLDLRLARSVCSRAERSRE